MVTILDNAKMENFRAKLKIELIDGQVYATHTKAKRAIFSDIEVFYTTARGFYSPVDFDPNLNQTSLDLALRLILKTDARSPYQTSEIRGATMPPQEWQGS